MDTVACRICGHKEAHLGPHLWETHGLSLAAYLERYPGAPTVSGSLWDTMQDPSIRRKSPEPQVESEMGDFQVFVNLDVPVDRCLTMPPHYRLPQFGELAYQVEDALVSILRGRNILIHGPPGTGKDALVHAVSHTLRRPAILKQIRPDADIESWFFVRSFDQNGTSWEEGALLKAIRDGYLVENGPRKGQRIPYLILMTDIDRATRSQAENFRLILDSIEGRVEGPGGEVHPILPGTQFVCTANSSGGGDPTGRMISSNAIDASLMDRLDAGVGFSPMSWEDESVVLSAKFPRVIQEAPGMMEVVRKTTAKIRDAIQKETLYAEFSHRAVCRWLQKADDIIHMYKSVPNDLVARSVSAWINLLPDDEQRRYAMSLIQNDIPGGLLGRNVDRSDQSDDPLGGF